MLILAIGFILGAILGSFIYCIAVRLIQDESFKGRSHCPHCKHTLAWFDLIPLFSYLSQRGKCRYCKKSISKEYILIEILMALLIAGLFAQTFSSNSANLVNLFSAQNIFWNINQILEVVFKIFILSVLVIVGITDIKTGLIPNRVTYPATIIAFFYLLTFALFKVWVLFQALQSSPLGKYLLPPYSDYFYRHAILESYIFWGGVLSALGVGLFFLLLIIFTKGKGMGGGDFKLSIFEGLVFNFPGSVLAILLSFLLGSIVSLTLIAFGKKKFGQTIPFGPFMSAGGIIAVFYGNQILNWYFTLKF